MPSRYPWPSSIALGCLLGYALQGCDPPPMQTQQVVPVVAFVPDSAYSWPLWPVDDGWLVGGTGYRTGYGPPWPIGPGLGLGALLLPSRLSGGWLTLPGPWPPLPIVVEPTPFPLQRTWSKMGPTILPAGSPAPWPNVPYYLSPWGPVSMRAGPFPSRHVPGVWLGFPTADGTPVSNALMAAFIRSQGDYAEIVQFDPLSRTLQRPPSLVAFGHLVTDISITTPAVPNTGISGGGPLILVSLPIGMRDNLRWVDILTGAYDTLPEIRTAVGIEHGLSAEGRFIVYTEVDEPVRHVRMFDRRQRLIDRLERLNAGRATFDPAIDATGRWLAYVTLRDDHLAIEIYDTIAGVVDPLPALNGLGNLSAPNLSNDARWLVFVANALDNGVIYAYDRLTGALDRLPELNREGPMRDVSLSGDGLIIQANVFRQGHWQAVWYLRPSGIIDRLPELNEPGWEVRF